MLYYAPWRLLGRPTRALLNTLTPASATRQFTRSTHRCMRVIPVGAGAGARRKQSRCKLCGGQLVTLYSKPTKRERRCAPPSPSRPRTATRLKVYCAYTLCVTDYPANIAHTLRIRAVCIHCSRPYILWLGRAVRTPV